MKKFTHWANFDSCMGSRKISDDVGWLQLWSLHSFERDGSRVSYNACVVALVGDDHYMWEFPTPALARSAYENDAILLLPRE